MIKRTVFEPFFTKNNCFVWYILLLLPYLVAKVWQILLIIIICHTRNSLYSNKKAAMVTDVANKIQKRV